MNLEGHTVFGPKWKWVLLILFFLASAVLIVYVKERNRSSDEIKVHREDAAPEFTLPDLDGKPVTLSNLKGKVVVLNFWATWCGPCRAEMPEFQRYFNSHKEEFYLLAINCSEPQGKVNAFCKEFGYTFPVLLDEDGAIQKLYGIQAYPTTFVIDPSGIVLSVRSGTISRPERYFERWLSKYRPKVRASKTPISQESLGARFNRVCALTPCVCGGSKPLNTCECSDARVPAALRSLKTLLKDEPFSDEQILQIMAWKYPPLATRSGNE